MRRPTESDLPPLQTRTYGTTGPQVIVLHGGPAAPGTMAAVARGLADDFRVLEPFQRGSGPEPLTVARHVADLHQLVSTRCPEGAPALVGSSWGAMLALAYAATHPVAAGPLVLVGCGSFDRAARLRMQETLDERLDPDDRRRMRRLRHDVEDPDERLEAMADFVLPHYSYDPITLDQEIETVDARAHQETWTDMVRLQSRGVYPAAFTVIDSRVLMLHGAYDPHPGEMIRTSLEPFLPQLEYRRWERCGHYPWLERAVRDEFFALLRSWLTAAAPPLR